MKKILCYFIVGILFIGISTGCEEQKETDKKDQNTIVEEKGNCKIEECMIQLKSSNTVSEINDMIGFDGEKDSTEEKYTWKLNEKEKIVATYTDKKATIQATIDKDKIKNEEVDFSIYTDLKGALDKGESFTYDELVAKLNNIKGTLAGITSTSKRYIWVDSLNRTFSVTFSDTLDGKCSIMSLR